MSHIVDFPDSLYEQLQSQAMAAGFATIPELLANSRVEPRAKVDREQMLADRRAVFERIKANRQAIFERTGRQPDSVPLIREDRDR